MAYVHMKALKQNPSFLSGGKQLKIHEGTHVRRSFQLAARCVNGNVSSSRLHNVSTPPHCRITIFQDPPIDLLVEERTVSLLPLFGTLFETFHASA
jgi:hypothetical protein